MPDAKAQAKAPAAPKEPPQKPGLFSRFIGGLRYFFRAFLRRSVFVPVLAALLLGADAWAVVTINGWEENSDDLRAEATELGEAIGEADAGIESAEAEIAVLDEQRDSALLRANELGEEAAAEQALTDAIRDVALDLDQCMTNRFKVIKGIWAGSAVAALDAKTDRECSAAKSALDQVIEEMD